MKITTTGAYGDAVRAVRAGELNADEAAEQLVKRMTDRELLGLLDGDSPGMLLPLIPMLLHRRPFVAGAVPRLGIPGIRFSDGGRGVVIGASTAFPVTMRAPPLGIRPWRNRWGSPSAWKPGLGEPTTPLPSA